MFGQLGEPDGFVFVQLLRAAVVGISHNLHALRPVDPCFSLRRAGGNKRQLPVGIAVGCLGQFESNPRNGEALLFRSHLKKRDIQLFQRQTRHEFREILRVIHLCISFCISSSDFGRTQLTEQRLRFVQPAFHRPHRDAKMPSDIPLIPSIQIEPPQQSGVLLRHGGEHRFHISGHRDFVLYRNLRVLQRQMLPFFPQMHPPFVLRDFQNPRSEQGFVPQTAVMGQCRQHGILQNVIRIGVVRHPVPDKPLQNYRMFLQKFFKFHDRPPFVRCISGCFSSGKGSCFL